MNFVKENLDTMTKAFSVIRKILISPWITNNFQLLVSNWLLYIVKIMNFKVTWVKYIFKTGKDFPNKFKLYSLHFTGWGLTDEFWFLFLTSEKEDNILQTSQHFKIDQRDFFKVPSEMFDRLPNMSLFHTIWLVILIKKVQELQEFLKLCTKIALKITDTKKIIKKNKTKTF